MPRVRKNDWSWFGALINKDVISEKFAPSRPTETSSSSPARVRRARASPVAEFPDAMSDTLSPVFSLAFWSQAFARAQGAELQAPQSWESLCSRWRPRRSSSRWNCSPRRRPKSGRKKDRRIQDGRHRADAVEIYPVYAGPVGGLTLVDATGGAARISSTTASASPGEEGGLISRATPSAGNGFTYCGRPTTPGRVGRSWRRHRPQMLSDQTEMVRLSFVTTIYDELLPLLDELRQALRRRDGRRLVVIVEDLARASPCAVVRRRPGLPPGFRRP